MPLRAFETHSLNLSHHSSHAQHLRRKCLKRPIRPSVQEVLSVGDGPQVGELEYLPQEQLGLTLGTP